jgi:hypothetical protein
MGLDKIHHVDWFTSYLKLSNKKVLEYKASDNTV